MQSRIVEIPLNKLVPSDANVRKTQGAVGVEELAANIAASGGQLIQSLAIRPVLNDADEETGVYRVSAGGRRLAALKLLAKRRVIAKNAPIPCVLCAADEQEVSLSENVMREPLHPADQFVAFKALQDRGQGAEEIGARFGVTAHVVRQRLRLADVSPALMQTYREGGLTLDQLMAFAVTEDQARQDQVHAALAPNLQPYLIRRMLTEAQVPARDKRAIFVGADDYIAAGGSITRDLFSEDLGGWFTDPVLLDRLVIEKLDAIAAELQTRDGWKWTLTGVEFPNVYGMGRYYARSRDLSDPEQQRLDALTTRFDDLAANGGGDGEVSIELETLSLEIDALMALGRAFDPEDIARSGTVVSLGHDGAPRIECGFVRSEDAPKDEPAEPGPRPAGGKSGGEATEADDGGEGAPLSDALVRDLTAHRTMALRLALGNHPETALIAVVHAMALRTFYGSASATCLDVTPKSASLGIHAAGVDDTPTARAVAERGQGWAERLPDDPSTLWALVERLEPADRLALLAHCASLTVFAVREPWDRSGRYVAASDYLARATGLDMGAHWQPTATTYFSRVTKAQIIEAVREAVSEDAARPLGDLKKAGMAEAAETAVAGTGWLPAILRTPALPSGPEAQDAA